MKTMTDCPGHERCESPLCPLHDDLDDCLWYPDEDVCSSRGYTKLHWLKKQKRIKRLKLSSNVGYFTAKMLSSIKAVSKSIKGIDPDGRASIDVWLGRRAPTPSP